MLTGKDKAARIGIECGLLLHSAVDTRCSYVLLCSVLFCWTVSPRAVRVGLSSQEARSPVHAGCGSNQQILR